MNSWMTCLLGGARKPPPLAERAVRVAPAAEDEIPAGCGWFDSSHELQHGLWVQEHATPDAVANDLPLGEWLELHMAARGAGLTPAGSQTGHHGGMPSLCREPAP